MTESLRGAFSGLVNFTAPERNCAVFRLAAAPLSTEASEIFRIAVSQVVTKSGRVDVLVNNAGYGAYGAIEDVPMSIARDQMEVNLFALARMVQLVLPTMRRQRSGRIINIGSIAGKLWTPLGGWYHTSKFALEGFTDCLRNEVRPFGIKVSLIEPGSVKTEWSGIMLENLRKYSGSSPYSPLIPGVSKMLGRESGTASSEHIAQNHVTFHRLWQKSCCGSAGS
jgi:short-subunit dehydrogenase